MLYHATLHCRRSLKPASLATWWCCGRFWTGCLDYFNKGSRKGQLTPVGTLMQARQSIRMKPLPPPQTEISQGSCRTSNGLLPATVAALGNRGRNFRMTTTLISKLQREPSEKRNFYFLFFLPQFLFKEGFK